MSNVVDAHHLHKRARGGSKRGGLARCQGLPEPVPSVVDGDHPPERMRVESPVGRIFLVGRNMSNVLDGHHPPKRGRGGSKRGGLARCQAGSEPMWSLVDEMEKTVPSVVDELHEPVPSVVDEHRPPKRARGGSKRGGLSRSKAGSSVVDEVKETVPSVVDEHRPPKRARGGSKRGGLARHQAGSEFVPSVVVEYHEPAPIVVDEHHEPAPIVVDEHHPPKSARGRSKRGGLARCQGNSKPVPDAVDGRQQAKRTRGGSKRGALARSQGNSVTAPNSDIPIFSREFLAYNKGREAKLRSLRREIKNAEAEVEALQRTIEKMQAINNDYESEAADDEKVERKADNIIECWMKVLRESMGNTMEEHNLQTPEETVEFLTKLANGDIQNKSLLQAVKKAVQSASFPLPE